MVLLQQLQKRKEYNYSENSYFDSLNNTLNYPLNKFIVCNDLNHNLFEEQVKKYCLDFCYKSSENIYLLCLSFQNNTDYENFNNVMNFNNVYDLKDSKNLKYLLQ